MMKKREFVTRVRRQLPSYLPEDIRSDVRLSEVRTTKTNDRKLYGLSIRRGGEAAAPTFYLDDLYHRYVMGEDPDDLIRMFAEEYLQLEKLRRVPLGMPPPDEDGCVTLLALRLLSRERNRDYLQNLPYLDVGNGLVLTCDFRAWDNSSGEWRMRITHDLLGELGLTEEELFSDALYSCSVGNPARLFRLEDTAAGSAPRNILDAEEPLPEEDRSSVFILTAKSIRLGAAALFYKGIPEQLARLFREGYYIVPTSVHEMMIVPDSAKVTPQKLLELLEYSNRCMLEPEDYLSDDLLYYDPELHEICTVADVRDMN